MDNIEKMSNSEKIGEIRKRVSRIVKRYEQYGRKAGKSEMIWKIWKEIVK